MRIALSGATGFLGQYLQKYLIDAGDQVIALSRRPPSHSTESVRWVTGDLSESTSNTLTKNVDYVIHAGLAREGSGFLDHPEDPVEYFQTNVIASLQLIESAIANGVRRLVFVSSGAVHDRVDQSRPLDESHPLWPTSLYGAYKASVETQIHAYGLSGKLDCCTLRPTAIYGVARRKQESKWYDLVHNIAAGKDVEATGGGKMVHASDVARAIGLLLKTDQTVAGETYLCCDRMISHHEVASIAKRMSGNHAKILGSPKQSKHSIDTSKLRSLGMTFGGTSLLESTIGELLKK